MGGESDVPAEAVTAEQLICLLRVGAVDIDRAGIALMAVGTAAVATGVVVYVLNRERGGDTQLSLGWVPGAGGAGTLQMGGRF